MEFFFPFLQMKNWHITENSSYMDIHVAVPKAVNNGTIVMQS